MAEILHAQSIETTILKEREAISTCQILPIHHSQE